MDVRKFSFEENYDQEDKFPDEKNLASKDDVSYLSINIGTDISAKSSHCLADLLQYCMGRVSFQIKVPVENDLVRARLDQIKEQLSRDPNVQFQMGEERKSIVDDQKQDYSSANLPSTTSDQDEDKASSSLLLSREIKFDTISDVIILYAWSDVFMRIQDFARKHKISLRITSEGFLLQGGNETQLNKVESYIKECHNNMIDLKLFQGEPLEKINAASYAFRNIKGVLAKKANLIYVFTLTSDQYYKAYLEVSRKVPELANRLTEEKLKKTNLRLVLNGKNIREDQNRVQEFRKVLAETAKPFKEIIRIESDETFSQEDLNELKRLASQTSFYFAYEPNKIINDQQSLKIKTVQQMTLLTYYSQESEKADLQKAAKILKQQIIEQIRPNLMCEFFSATDHLKYDKFVRPEIQEKLKEKNVSVEIVRNDMRKGLALNIQGDRKEAQKIKDLIFDLMKRIKCHTYYIKASKHVLRDLVKQENDCFFLNYFDQVYKSYPNVKLIKSFKKESLTIEILYKNEKERKDLTGGFDHDFSELTSKLINSKLSELLEKANTNVKEFKTSYNIIVSEFFDKNTQTLKTAIVGDPASVKAALEVIESLKESAKPLAVDIDIHSRLIQRAFKKEEKNFIPRGISCKLS